MDEFNFKGDIGTSVKKLKSIETNDLDYDSILKNINTDRTQNLVDIIENDIKASNYKNKKSKNEDLFDFLENNIEDVHDTNIKRNKDKKRKNNKNFFYKYTDIILCILVFMLLNNKLIIEIIYKISFIKNCNHPFPNLLFRTIIFAIILVIFKKISY